MGILTGLLSIGSLGCEDEAIETTQAVDETEPAAELPEPEEPVRESMFDAEGNLRESGESIVGLALPMGLQHERDAERRHIYSIQAPIQKVAAFFGPRLLTGTVDRIGDGAVYRGATIEGSPVRVDVSILQTGSRVRVEVTELPPMPENPPDPEELMREWRENMHRLD